MRRLLKAGLDAQENVLVLGHPGPVRRVWPEARVDVVGEAPEGTGVTVVSEAKGPGSIPRRWSCVVLTDRSAEAERVSAAVDACRPQGVVAIMVDADTFPALPPRAEVERVLKAHDVRLVLVRVRS